MNSNVHSTPSTDSRPDRALVSEAVVDAVAAADGVSALDVHPPLATVIDPDALDKLVDGMASLPDEPAGTVSFPYGGYDVTVSEDGSVAVAALDARD